MSMSLYESVVNESFGMDFNGEVDTRLDPATEAEINDRVDDETSMMQYTGECLTGMMALEAAIAKFDGISAVKAMVAKNNNDTVALEQLDAAMEGFIGNVWETLKEWVNKAYKAIKNFLIKQWNKMKGAANVVKAFFGKYGDVLRSKKVPGCRVKWMDINIQGAEKTYQTFSQQIDGAIGALSTVRITARATDKAFEDRYNKAKANQREDIDTARQAMRFDSTTHPGAGYAAIRPILERIPSPKDVHDSLRKNIYGDNDTDREVEFESIRRDAIEAADIASYKKYVDYFNSMGDKGQAECLKAIQQAQKNLAKDRELDKSRGVTVIHNGLRQCLHAMVELHRLCMSAMYTAAKKIQSYAVSACRKAIMHHSTKGEGATETEESWNAFGSSNSDSGLSNLMAEYI